MLWPVAAEGSDPWYEDYREQVRAQDASAFAAREDRNIILAGGGTVSWSTATGLTWTSPFTVWSPSTGFFSRLPATTLLPTDGQVIRAEIVRAPGQNVNVAAEVANIAQNTDNSFVLGIRSGTSFIFRNGSVIQNGESIEAEDLFGGGPDNFSWKVIPAGKTVTIPTNQQMLLSGGITINGALNIDGELTFV